MKIRFSVVIIILLLDFIIVQYLMPYKHPNGNHDAIFTVIVLQSYAIIDILINFRITLFFLDFLGLYKKRREIIIIASIILMSFFELRPTIIGTNQWGNLCLTDKACPKLNRLVWLLCVMFIMVWVSVFQKLLQMGRFILIMMKVGC